MRPLVIAACLAFLLWAGVAAIQARPEPRRHRSAAQAYWQAERGLVAALHREGVLGREVRRLRAENGLLKAHVRRFSNLRRLQAVHHDAPTLAYAIRLASVVYGVSPSEMYRVARCESNLYRYARNGIYRSYWQEGPMFERSRFGRAGFVIWDPIASALSTAETVAREGWVQWECKP
jgi:hypothetical protein